MAQLRALEELDGWQRLEELGALFEEHVRAGLRKAGCAYQFQRIGSMFCLYFTDQPVFDLASAQTSDRAAFARYFHAALDGGVYFAPSQFEAGFISTAHSATDMEKTTEIATRALGR